MTSQRRKAVGCERAARDLRQGIEERNQEWRAEVAEHPMADKDVDKIRTASHLLEFLPDPTLAINRKGVVIAWNRAMENLTGVKAEDVLGKGNYEHALPIYGRRRPMLVDLVFEADEKVESGYCVARREQDALIAESELLFINGKGLYLQGKASAIQDSQGRLVGAVEILHDVTGQKLAEQALRESEERYRFLAENREDVLYRLKYDSMKYDYLGPAVIKLTGYTREEINDLGFYRLVERMEVVGREKVSLEDMAEKRLAGQVGEHQADYLITKKSGERIWLRDHSFPWHDQMGRLIGSVGILSDITARRMTEDALRESEKRFRMVVENVPLGISLMNSDLAFEYFNPKFTELLGYTLDDLPDKWQWFERAYPDPLHRAEVVSLWRQQALDPSREGTVNDQTLTVCCKDGKEKLIDIRTVKMDDGRQLLTYQDITEHRNLEIHSRQVHKMEAIGTLAGGIAHDFNNILAAIMGYTEMTLANASPESMAERNLRQVLKAANRAKDLIKQILMFTREGEKEHRPVPIQPILKEALKLLRASIPKTIEIRRNIRLKSEGIVLADPTQIHQVLMNLCTNASHAMREKGGILEVVLTEVNPGSEASNLNSKLRDTPCLKLAVSDTGTGIDPAIMDRIFDPFFTTKEQGQGTGMGLAVVHGIVASHGGAIAVNSRVGKGSTFTVYLPRREEVEVGGKAAPSSIQRGTGCILFVDDEENLADLGKEMLGDLGYEVVSMTDSQAALELFCASPGRFDLVFTDYTMPQLTGAELAQRILAVRPELPVILCTGYSEAIDEDKAREMGIHAFAMKPLSQRDIAQVVSLALPRK